MSALNTEPATQQPTEQCDNCATSLTKTDQELYCPECGLVHSDSPVNYALRYGSSQQVEDSAARNSERGSKVSTNGTPGRTTIGYENGSKDSRGNTISHDKWLRLQRLRKQWKRTISDIDTDAEYRISQTIDRMASELEINNKAEQMARNLGKQINEQGLVGRSADTVAAACIYIGIRNSSVVRQPGEIAAYTGATKREMISIAKNIKSDLGLKLDIQMPSDYLPRMATELELKPDLRALSRYLTNDVEEIGIGSGYSPRSVAAAVIHAASLCHKGSAICSQREINRELSITVWAMRDLFDTLKARLAELFDLNETVLPDPTEYDGSTDGSEIGVEFTVEDAVMKPGTETEVEETGDSGSDGPTGSTTDQSNSLADPQTPSPDTPTVPSVSSGPVAVTAVGVETATADTWLPEGVESQNNGSQTCQDPVRAQVETAAKGDARSHSKHHAKVHTEPDTGRTRPEGVDHDTIVIGAGASRRLRIHIGRTAIADSLPTIPHKYIPERSPEDIAIRGRPGSGPPIRNQTTTHLDRPGPPGAGPQGVDSPAHLQSERPPPIRGNWELDPGDVTPCVSTG